MKNIIRKRDKMGNSKIETEYLLFTAEVTAPYYMGDELQIINIVAKTIEEALATAKEYVTEHHVRLKIMNNDAKTIYMLTEKSE